MADEERYEQMELEFEFKKPVIKGYPELRWTGKRPFKGTQFFPAQLKETYGDPDETGWMNKIFWGDNLQVMSHLLKDFRGKIDLIYIDPPFDSKADYKKTIKVRGKEILNDNNVFEEKQYGDIWTNDEYLQFMYERLILLRELLSDKGSIYLHCDWHKSHHLRCIMDDIFGPQNLRNEIAWCYTGPGSPGMKQFNRKHDTILWYSKTDEWVFNADAIRVESTVHAGGFKGEMDTSVSDSYSEKGKIPEDWWEFAVASRFKVDDNLRVGYPTEKPFKLLDRIIETSSNPGDIVLDVFAGGGTTPAEALRLDRRFICADINLGSIQLTSKRLLNILNDSNSSLLSNKKAGFEVYNVNNYDFFRNPVQAKELLMEALQIQPFAQSNVFDGELDGRHVKILSINRIATKADLGELVANLPYKEYEKRKEDNPTDPVDRITLVCMGHEPDLKAGFEQMVGSYKIDVEIVDILRDKTDLEFKREATAKVEYKHDELVIKEFYPMNLLQKLSLQKENVDDWRQLVDSIMVDFNYDGKTLKPQIIDIPEKNDLVKGRYNIPKNHGAIKVKITDLLSESLEVEVK